MAMPDREDLIGRLTDAIGADELFRAAWLGGADATGRADEHSDLDVVVIVGEGRDEEALAAIETSLGAIAPIGGRYRLPSPTWHGHEQMFWVLDGYGMAGLVDLVVLHPGEQGRWLVAERHGEARVLVDRDGLIKAAPLDREELGRTIEKRVADLRARVPVLAPLALKEAQRGRALDALNFYHGLVLRPLVEMLRIVHCPERWDYGMRYLDRDLPEEVHARVRELAFVGSCEEIERGYVEAVAMFEEVVRRAETESRP
jgi:hypothetical protein